jgi:hypothetical protein
MWTDDERSTSFMSTYNNMKNNNCDYVPVWKVIKEMYDEDKQALYCFVDNKDYNSSLDLHYCDYYSDVSTDYSDEEGYASDIEDDTESQTDSAVTSNEELDEYNNKYLYI